MGTLGEAVVASTATTRTRRTHATRATALLAFAAVLAGALVALQPAPRAAAASPCGAAINPVVCENRNGGTDPEIWDIDGAGDPTIQGFATDISVNAGDAIDFKIDTDATDYDIDIYRTGWYQGDGARYIQSVQPTLVEPQRNECKTEQDTGLVDCGTWDVSATWDVPATAVSGVYIARLERSDTHGASHIIFIVRRDGNTSDVLFQTSDPTWHAYNLYGGADFYQGGEHGRAFKISYNRPFATRGGIEARDFYFSSEFATVRFLERNGYDVSYLAGLDTDRRGGELLNHRVFLSVGHDEYWSGPQRANIEAARDAGVNLQFLSGNEGYWRTRYEPSIDDTHTDHRTLVSYKETWADEKIDPDPQWTGTWRDPRFADASQGGHLPENALTGTMYMVNDVRMPVTVTGGEGDYRLWRHTGLENLAAGEAAELADQTVGYESNEDIDNGFRPDGLIRLSTTVGPVTQYLLDHGKRVTAGTTEHHVTLYRAASGALVFSAGSVQWGWGLDSTHDGDRPAADSRMQQAQVNLLADMGAQPGSLMPELVAATASTDTVAPTAAILTPTAAQQVPHGSTVTVTGTASDVGGGVVAGVEVSTDGGATWHPAEGTTDWSYTYLQQGHGQAEIIARAIDDSANFTPDGAHRTVAVTGPASVFGEEAPAVASSSDTQRVELGLQFTPEVDGFVTGVRFYKGAQNTGIHVGRLWGADAEPLAVVQFGGETATGWQSALFNEPVAVTAGTPYVVSYTAPKGGYSYVQRYWPYQARTTSPLAVTSGVGQASPAVYGFPGERPTRTADDDANYFVDATFETQLDTTVRVGAREPAPRASSIQPDSDVTVVFTGDVEPGSVTMTLTAPGGQAVAGTLSYDPAMRTARFAPTAALAESTTYTATVDAVAVGGAAFDGGAPWTFTTTLPVPPEGQCPCSLYTPLDRPLISSTNDTDEVTLGTRFTVDQPGAVTAVRFFKGPANPGVHAGALWSADGERLAETTFTDESTSGWQTAQFAEPVPVQPGVEYVVSYDAPGGGYALTPSAYDDGHSRGPLHVPAGGAVFSYAGGHPWQPSRSSYHVDLVFEPDASGPTLVSTSPARGVSGVDRDTSIAATFSEALQAAPVVTVTADGGAIAGTTTMDAAHTTVTFTPTAPLPHGADVTVEIAGIAGSSAPGAAVTTGFRVQLAPNAADVHTFFGDAPPAGQQADDATPVELGMSFHTSVAGVVSALRFFKASGDSATHTGTLWAPDGTELASVVFAHESASGWQRAALSEPVELVAGQTYTVSYYSPQGRYVAESGYFDSVRTSGPLTASTVGNGAFRYGAGGERPTSSWRASSYFVDVEFTPGTGTVPPVTVTARAPLGAGVPIIATVSATLSADAPSPSLTVTTAGAAVAGTVDYDPGTRRLTFTAHQPLTRATTYTASVMVAGGALDQWTFTTEEPDVPGDVETIFGSAVPQTASAADRDPIEVGTAFTVSRPGSVTALRFYKGPNNAGAHVGSLWDSAGARIAQVDFATESATGWQRAALSQPVALTPGETYVVSYFAPAGGFAITPAYFGADVTRGALTAPGGANGRFNADPAGGHPTQSWNSSAYFVDVEVTFGDESQPGPILTPDPTPTPTPTPVPTPTPSPTPSPSPVGAALSARAPTAGQTRVAPTTTVTATFAADAPSASLALAAAAGEVAGTSTYDQATRTVTFTAQEPLAWSTVYTATVHAASAPVTDGTWSFTTSAEPTVIDVTTIFGDGTPANPWWDDPDGVQVATRFSVDTAGEATGIRFYKGTANTGAHTGYLWDAEGGRVAEVEFADETGDGWQIAEFATPVTLEPGVEYRAGLYSTTGRYAVDLYALTTPKTVGHFTIPFSGSAHIYSREFPTNLSTHNYWVDVTFVPSG